MITKTLLFLYNNKVVALMLAVWGSVAIDEFLVQYDWGHSIFGLLGFIVGWALIQIDDHVDEVKKARYWFSRLLLSLIVPVLTTNWLADKTDWNHIFVAFLVGIFPDVVIMIIKEVLKRKTDKL